MERLFDVCTEIFQAVTGSVNYLLDFLAYEVKIRIPEITSAGEIALGEVQEIGVISLFFGVGVAAILIASIVYLFIPG